MQEDTFLLIFKERSPRSLDVLGKDLHVFRDELAPYFIYCMQQQSLKLKKLISSLISWGCCLIISASGISRNKLVSVEISLKIRKDVVSTEMQYSLNFPSGAKLMSPV